MAKVCGERIGEQGLRQDQLWVLTLPRTATKQCVQLRSRLNALVVKAGLTTALQILHQFHSDHSQRAMGSTYSRMLAEPNMKT
jgi:hypothetical protein